MVKALLERVVEEFRAQGHEPEFINYSSYKGKLPRFTVHVHETQRINHHTLDNVTVTIDVAEHSGNVGHWVARIKVPKDASDKVIRNRVEKALSYINK